MSLYIWQQQDWPSFQWSYEAIVSSLSAVHRKQGRILGQVEILGFKDKEKTYVNALTQDVLKTSEIEGEKLDEEQVRSSIARKLHLPQAGTTKQDRTVDGIVEVTLDATQNAQQPLTKHRLCQWHAALFPTGKSGWNDIAVGSWRADQMIIVSGSEGKQKVHYEAPPPERIDQEMQQLIDWFEGGPSIDWVIKAAVAHLWFETIHPFDDGNGRIGRAIADMALARSDEMSQRFYSMSARIRTDRSQYYEMLERTQKGHLEITPWINWFTACLSRAIDDSQTQVETVLEKQTFWQKQTNLEITDRQRKVLNKLLDESKTALKTSDYGRIAKCSQDTAHRDILDLIEKGVLSKDSSGGRSTKYVLSDSVFSTGV